MSSANEMKAALLLVANAMEEAYRFKPTETDDYIYDSLPSSAMAMAYFAVVEALGERK